MPSFDVVSEVDLHAFSNAVDQAMRVVDTRFDFKGVDARFERNAMEVTVFADADFQVQQMQDILKSTLVKVKIDPLAMQASELETAGKQVKCLITMQTGLATDVAKAMVKTIKSSGIKVQAQIQGDQLRVTGKKRDDLQRVMALLKDMSLEQPLQFTNFRD